MRVVTQLWFPREPMRVWGNKEHPVLGEELVSSSCKPLEGGGPPASCPAAIQWQGVVLLETSLDGIAKPSELEDACRGCCLVLSGPVLQMPREWRKLLSSHPGQKLRMGLAFRAGCFPLALRCSGSPHGSSEQQRWSSVASV